MHLERRGPLGPFFLINQKQNLFEGRPPLKVTVRDSAGPPMRRVIKDLEGGRQLAVSMATWREVVGDGLDPSNELDPGVWRLLELAELEALHRHSRAYLAAAERSPLAFSRWLERRHVSGEWAQRLTQSMTEENLLSPKRYGALVMERAAARGHQPLWLVKKKIIAAQVPKKMVEELSFDEVGALRGFLRRRRLLGQDKKALIKKLKTKGFPFPVIAKALEPEGPEEEM